MSEQVLRVTLPFSKERQSAALLNQCIAVSSSTYSPRKNFSKCARDPSRQPSPHTTYWCIHEMPLSTLTERIPGKYCFLKSKVFFHPHLIFPHISCNPRWSSKWFWLVVWEDKFFWHGKELGHVVLPEVGVRICVQEPSHLKGCKWDGSHYRSAMAMCPARRDSSAQVKTGGAA